MIRKILRSILCGLLVLICLFFAVVVIGKHQLGKMWFFEDCKISFWMKESALKSELGQPADTNILLKRLIIYRFCCIMDMVMKNEKIHFYA